MVKRGILVVYLSISSRYYFKSTPPIQQRHSISFIENDFIKPIAIIIYIKVKKGKDSIYDKFVHMRNVRKGKKEKKRM